MTDWIALPLSARLEFVDLPPIVPALVSGPLDRSFQPPDLRQTYHHVLHC